MASQILAASRVEIASHPPLMWLDNIPPLSMLSARLLQKMRGTLLLHEVRRHLITAVSKFPTLSRVQLGTAHDVLTFFFSTWWYLLKHAKEFKMLIRSGLPGSDYKISAPSQPHDVPTERLACWNFFCLPRRAPSRPWRWPIGAQSEVN